MRLTIAAKISAGFILALLILVFIGIVSYRNVKHFEDNANLRKHAHDVLITLEELQSQLKDAQRGERGYVITGEERFLEPYRTGINMVPIISFTRLQSLRKSLMF